MSFDGLEKAASKLGLDRMRHHNAELGNAKLEDSTELNASG